MWQSAVCWQHISWIFLVLAAAVWCCMFQLDFFAAGSSCLVLYVSGLTVVFCAFGVVL
jgi:hypothetical protein